MSGASLNDAVDEMYGAVHAGNNLPVTSLATTVTRVYDYEPKPGDQIRGCPLTVSAAGMTPDFFLVAVRLYQQLAADARTAQRTISAAVEAVDELVPSSFGPSNWTIDVREDIDALVAECVYERGREDYY